MSGDRCGCSDRRAMPQASKALLGTAGRDLTGPPPPPKPRWSRPGKHGAHCHAQVFTGREQKDRCQRRGYHPSYCSCCPDLDVLKLTAVCVCVFKELLVQPFSAVHFRGSVVQDSASKVSLSTCTVPA